ncbi:MAG: tetratricopeptide repeat protein [Bacteroidia bacterium]|nr:tetratricopeptide repeat protein [Bacteroidia bacterium]
MKNRSILWKWVCVLTLTGHSVGAQISEISGGNREYEKGRYRNAESSYRKALEKDARQYTGNYNLGNALYRQGKFEEASQQYLNASAFNNQKETQAKSLYNMGNAFLKAEKYKESVESYKKALRINPGDEDARYNLSYALKKLRQQQQNQEKNKEDQQKKQQDQQQKNQDQQKDQQQKDQQKEQQQQSGQQPKLSKEEAERMLRALKNDEKDLQKEKARKYPVTSSSPEKNW